METILQDLRFGARMLARSPVFTAVALLTIALAIGANTAIFSVVNTVLLRPLPYEDPDRLVKIWTRFTGIGLPDDRNWVSAPEFVDLRAKNRSLSHVAAMSARSFNVTFGAAPERIEGAAVSAALFPMLGVKPVLGRLFAPEEEQPGRDNVLLLGHGLWTRRFGGDRNIAGRQLTVSGRSFTVAGVLPPEFQYPGEAEMWMPLAFSQQALNARGSHGLEALARLRPGFTLEQSSADLRSVARAMIEENPQYPYRNFNFAWITIPLQEESVAGVKKGLWVLMCAVACVLLIACFNVANLLLARATSREREVAIRMALGAGRARLIRQLLTESLLLATAGGLAGLVVARWGVRALTAMATTTLPRVREATLDGQVLLFTMAITLGAGILFGLVPAIRAARGVTQESLKEGGRGASGGIGGQRLRRALVAAELALSLVLLAGAGLLLKSFVRLLEVDAGFRSHNILTMRIVLPGAKYPKQEQWARFFRDLVERARALPGVESAGISSAVPLTTAGGSGTILVETQAVPETQRAPEADQRPVTPGYFETMGFQLIRGRLLDERDTAASQPVVVVDETLAAAFWPNDDPIGKRIKRGGPGSTQPWLTVVGVVKHVRHYTLETPARTQIYWPYAQFAYPAGDLAIRTALPPAQLADAVRRAVLAIDADQPIYRVRTMEEIVAESVARRRLVMSLLGVFAVAALALASVGIYGVMSNFVEQRTHDLGVRIALGAGARDVLRHVLGQGLAITVAGLTAGLAGSFAVMRLIGSMLFQVRAGDPPTFLVVALTLTLVAITATLVPARRATRVDPIVALRHE
jgi:predicted permease